MTTITLFVPCFVELLRPSLTQRCLQILRALGVDANIPKDSTCCGQPSYNAGHWGPATRCAEKFIRDFSRYEHVLSPSASCVSMVNKMAELPELSTELRRDAEALSQRCQEICGFVSQRMTQSELSFALDGRMAYHDGCHALRGLGLHEAPRRLLGQIAGLELCELPGRPECCGFGGAFSVKYPELAADMADAKLRAMQRVHCQTLVSTDTSCLAHVEARARRRGVAFTGLHVVDVLCQGLA